MGVQHSESRKSLSNMLKTLLKPLEKNVRTAIFLSLYPTLFRLFNLARARSRSDSRQSKDSLDILVPSASILAESEQDRSRLVALLRTLVLPTSPAFLLAPLCVLLPINWLSQLNLYSTTAAGLALAKYISEKIDRRELSWRPSWARPAGLERSRRHRPYWMGERDRASLSSDELDRLAKEEQDDDPDRGDVLVTLRNAIRAGGAWWLFPLSQGWLLYTAVFEGDCFPTSYKNVIVSASPSWRSR